jgi:hypothetical protein
VVEGDKPVAAECLTGLAITVGMLGHTEQTTRLLGAAEAIQEAVTIHLIPPPDYERTVTMMREALGEAAFAAVWDTGRALTLEEAVTEALALDRAASEPLEDDQRGGPSTA